MYESVTYESIMERMLGTIPSTMDKREGSIIYDTLAPCAVELQLMYIELDAILSEIFADTASREYLIKRAAERGLSPTTATYAYLKGEFNIDVSIGARFSQSELNYVVTEKIDTGEYILQCETIGTDGNKNFGQLIPIDYIDGLTTASLTELLIPGEDEEDTEIFRTRYYNSFDSQAFGGNQADYIEKTNAIAGIGGVKVYPAWNGGGTVKLVIIDSEFNTPSDEFVSLVQETIDPTNDGSGVGIAPIGHVVTVQSTTDVTISIASIFTFSEGYDIDTAMQSLEEEIESYFQELRTTWADGQIIIRISQIESRLLELDAILDIESTSINESTSNIQLGADEIPVLGEVSENG